MVLASEGDRSCMFCGQLELNGLHALDALLKLLYRSSYWQSTEITDIMGREREKERNSDEGRLIQIV